MQWGNDLAGAPSVVCLQGWLYAHLYWQPLSTFSFSLRMSDSRHSYTAPSAPADTTLLSLLAQHMARTCRQPGEQTSKQADKLSTHAATTAPAACSCLVSLRCMHMLAAAPQSIKLQGPHTVSILVTLLLGYGPDQPVVMRADTRASAVAAGAAAGLGGVMTDPPCRCGLSECTRTRRCKCCRWTG